MKPSLTLLFGDAVPYRTQLIIPAQGNRGFHYYAIDQYFATSIVDEDSDNFYPTVEEAIAAAKSWIDEEIEDIRVNFPADYADIYGEQSIDGVNRRVFGELD